METITQQLYVEYIDINSIENSKVSDFSYNSISSYNFGSLIESNPYDIQIVSASLKNGVHNSIDTLDLSF